MDSLVSYLFALALSMLGAVGFLQYATNGLQLVKNSVIAQQASVINKAATAYIQDNTATLTAAAGATNPVVITIPTLACAGYLPSSYASGVGCPAPAWPTASLGIKNAYQQNWIVEVTQPNAGKLQAIVASTGGTAISSSDSKQMVQIAMQIGSAGGFVPYTNQGGDTTMNAANAQGIYGGWQLSLAGSGYTGGSLPAISSGHLVSLLSFANSNITNSYLYRASVPGQPQLNTMNTPILMNTPQTLGSACGAPGSLANDGNGGLLMCQTTATNGTVWSQFLQNPVKNVASLPACSAANSNTISLVAVSNSGGGTTPVPYVCGAGNPASPGTYSWTPVGVDVNGNLIVPNVATINQVALSGVATYGAACPTIGMLSQDGSGLPLTCQPTAVGGKAWSQTNQIVATSGAACTKPGMISRDASNNLYVCN